MTSHQSRNTAQVSILTLLHQNRKLSVWERSTSTKSVQKCLAPTVSKAECSLKCWVLWCICLQTICVIISEIVSLSSKKKWRSWSEAKPSGCLRAEGEGPRPPRPQAPSGTCPPRCPSCAGQPPQPRSERQARPRKERPASQPGWPFLRETAAIVRRQRTGGKRGVFLRLPSRLCRRHRTMERLTTTAWRHLAVRSGSS